ncbi:glutathione S-transferase family protein [Biformimicrobium ophioploci]|uniref:Glutathione S-transferase n=1 Tax=Biformimicrobium ophioploci TaxID=3036711 RepID=A0ABQ6LW62_9GAMM|nr:glutathione S-transferase family protein [Microbulbifer sp. NKW57]GMG86328.1 hypothetical protein MNKW57_06490 [Microbulbifer sp. NKW57]
MKLYSLPHSPYSARVRIQIALQGLPVEVLPPPIPLRTAEFYQHFPLGKLPVLELEDGNQVAESWAIMEYLEELSAGAGSGAALMPANPLDRARVRALGRYADLHLAVNALFPLFRAVTGAAEIEPGSLRDSLAAELRKGERLLAEDGTPERPMHLGDIALAPTIAYVLELAPAAGLDAPLAEFGHFSTWWSRMQGIPAVAETLQDMRQAYIAFAERMASKA